MRLWVCGRWWLGGLGGGVSRCDDDDAEGRCRMEAKKQRRLGGCGKRKEAMGPTVERGREREGVETGGNETK